MRDIWAIPIVFGILLFSVFSAQTVYGPHFTTLDGLSHHYQGKGAYSVFDVTIEISKEIAPQNEKRDYQMCVDWGKATDPSTSVPIEIVALDLASCQPITVIGETDQKNILLAAASFPVETIIVPSGIADITGTYEIVDNKGKPQTDPVTIDVRNVEIGTDCIPTCQNVDSFFDVFFSLFTVDSFFDIFTELQADVEELKGGTEDINIGIGELQEDVGTIQTEIVALDLRGQSCDIGDVVTGFVTGSDGTVQIQCAPDQTGLGDLQGKIDAKNAEIASLESNISTKEFDLASLQIQLDELTFPEQEILQCQQECASLQAQADQNVIKCFADARIERQDPNVVCASVIEARDNFSCTCSTTSDPDLAAQLEADIETIQTEIVALNAQLDDSQLELRILQVLQN